MQYPSDPDILSEQFLQPSIRSLRSIFQRANRGALTDAEAASLGLELSAVLQDETRRGFSPHCGGIQSWNPSPSGKNHLIFAGDLCAVVTIHGVFPLLYSCLHQEGDLFLHQIRWIEVDHLVLFDLCYLLGSEKKTVVCHYSPNDSAFVHQSASERFMPPPQQSTTRVVQIVGGEASEIRFCLHCGHHISKETGICTGCGKSAAMLPDPDATALRCLHCGGYIPAMSKFCPYCGKSPRWSGRKTWRSF